MILINKFNRLDATHSIPPFSYFSQITLVFCTNSKHNPIPLLRCSEEKKRRSESALLLPAHSFRAYQPPLSSLITFNTRFLSLGINGGDF
ncbi:hypothetical protein L6452_29402 [Arctium lappa]|uniref:Uncharacterized protein n=1 Tax=Arctium lappa TaxID=4217 RepID=A0ACB8ZH62_ARCLA|nr:hypothetical protein L6452_29402 [Arctium lappa]